MQNGFVYEAHFLYEDGHRCERAEVLRGVRVSLSTGDHKSLDIRQGGRVVRSIVRPFLERFDAAVEWSGLERSDTDQLVFQRVVLFPMGVM